MLCLPATQYCIAAMAGRDALEKLSAAERERRREQNRLAQRRFRRKHGQQRRSTEKQQVDNNLAMVPVSQKNQAVQERGDTLYQNLDPLSGTDVPWFETYNFDTLSTTSSVGTSHIDPFDQYSNHRFNFDSRLVEADVRRDSVFLASSPESLDSACRPHTIHLAVQKGNFTVVRLLLDHGTDYNTQDALGYTPLIQAVIGGFEEIAVLLLSHGARLDLLDNLHRSALFWAVLHRRDAILQKMLPYCKDNGSIINATAADGRTALHVAVESDFDEAVALLLKYGAIAA